ncbi:hypothetical protein Tco_0249745, partial [Tanacetum coccineum]
TYFNLQPHLNDETVIKINGEDKTVGSLVRAGLQRDFARRYRDKKCKFKDKWFNKKTVEQARRRSGKLEMLSGRNLLTSGPTRIG